MIANAVKNRIAMSDVSVVEPGDGPSPCESCDPRGPSNPRRRPPARRLRLATVMPFSAKPPSVPTSPLSRPRAPPRPVRDAMPSGTRRERRRVRVAGFPHLRWRNGKTRGRRTRSYGWYRFPKPPDADAGRVQPNAHACAADAAFCGPSSISTTNTKARRPRPSCRYPARICDPFSQCARHRRKRLGTVACCRSDPMATHTGHVQGKTAHRESVLTCGSEGGTRRPKAAHPLATMSRFVIERSGWRR